MDFFQGLVELGLPTFERGWAARAGCPALRHAGRVPLRCKGFHTNTRANQVTIAKDVIDSADRRPEFVLPQPSDWKASLLARVRMIPGF